VLIIQSQPLRVALACVLGHVQGISLVEDTPNLAPNVLLLFLEELRDHLLHIKSKRASDQEEPVAAESHLTLLINYLDQHFDEVKKTLQPLLDNGKNTFDLL